MWQIFIIIKGIDYLDIQTIITFLLIIFYGIAQDMLYTHPKRTYL